MECKGSYRVAIGEKDDLLYKPLFSVVEKNYDILVEQFELNDAPSIYILVSFILFYPVLVRSRTT